MVFAIENESWETYGIHEAQVRDFVVKYSGTSLLVTSFDISSGGRMRIC
jgi:hypothetical protein